MNGFRKIFNAPGVDLMPALPENHMLEKRFGSRLQQVCDERQGTRVFQGSSCFARWLYRVETFASAEEFLKYDRSEAAGCVVLELQMPGPSGLELQEALAIAPLRNLRLMLIQWDPDLRRYGFRGIPFG
jgi:hypothetical protein